MALSISLINCFYLIIPLLVWNIVLGTRITYEKTISDAHSPAWLLNGEAIARIIVFAFPLLLPLQLSDAWSKNGAAIYIAGTLLYFASWIPLLWANGSAWSKSVAGLLAPRLTPLLPFLGIALIGHSWLYGVLSTMFIVIHTIHGVQNISAS